MNEAKREIDVERSLGHLVDALVDVHVRLDVYFLGIGDSH